MTLIIAVELRTVGSWSYIFFYPDGLCFRISLLTMVNGEKINNDTDLNNAILSKKLDNSSGWGYYKVNGDNKIILHYLYEWWGNPVIFGYTLPIHIREKNIIGDSLLKNIIFVSKDLQLLLCKININYTI